MTREEREDAIDIIQSILDKYEEDECLVTEITIGDGDIKAFKMAIKALEQEPKEITLEDVKGYCKPRFLTIITNELYHELTHSKIRALERESRWIPISEGLPDTGDEVLCWYECYHWSQEKVLPEYGLGRYLRETSAWFGEVANGKDARVIAWMPLPQPYEPQKSEDKE